MSNPFHVATRALGAVLLLGLAICCQYGYLAAFEWKFPNIWHLLYATFGVAAVAGALWLISPAFEWLRTGRPNPHWASYWRLSRFFGLLSLFGVLTFMTGDPAWLGFMAFLLFLLPIPSRARIQP